MTTIRKLIEQEKLYDAIQQMINLIGTQRVVLDISDAYSKNQWAYQDKKISRKTYLENFQQIKNACISGFSAYLDHKVTV